MKRHTTAAFVFCIALAAAGVAEEKKSGKSSDKPGRASAKAPMIVVPPPADAAASKNAPRKLITSEMSGRDLQFFTTAIEAGRLQAYFVALLRSNGNSEQIKALGEALSGTQDEENKQIARLAGLKGWTVSLAPTAAEIKAGTEVGKLSGSNFDKAVMDKVLAASREAAKAYETAARSTDADIRAFCQQMLPLAQQKQQIVEKMTGAGSKAASELFRTNTPPVPPPPDKAAPVVPPVSAPPNPAAMAPPVATPPGTGTPATVLPPIRTSGSK